MNERDRALAILNHQHADQVPWLVDLDYWIAYLNAIGQMPDKYKGDGKYKLNRDLGAGYYLQGHFPFRTIRDDMRITETDSANGHTTRIDTPYGELSETVTWLPKSYCAAYTEHFVKSVKDLKALRYIYEHTRYEPDYSLAERMYENVGDNGIVLCYMPKSPFMEMSVYLAGIKTAAYAISDAPDEFDETLAIMGKKADEASEIALNSPAECLMIPENLSSELVGRNWFNRYVRPHDEKWTAKINGAGKYSFIHMDGSLKGTIKDVSDTGFTVIEAFTPAPAGDIEIEDISAYVNPNTILWGGIPGVYFTDLVNDADFELFVIKLLDVMKSNPRYVLGAADQVPPHSRFERIAKVRELVDKYGRYQ